MWVENLGNRGNDMHDGMVFNRFVVLDGMVHVCELTIWRTGATIRTIQWYTKLKDGNGDLPALGVVTPLPVYVAYLASRRKLRRGGGDRQVARWYPLPPNSHLPTYRSLSGFATVCSSFFSRPLSQPPSTAAVPVQHHRV